MAKSPAVSWHVLLEDEDWDTAEEVHAVPTDRPPVLPPSHPTRKRALQTIGLLFVLLFLSGYGFWESAQALQHPAGPTVSQPPPISADLLAAQARRILLTEHLRFDASGGDIAIVATALAEMEANYLDVFAAVGLFPTHGEDAPDGRLLVALRGMGAPVWGRAAGRVTLPSPTDLAAPAGTNRQELLRQAWQLALIDEVSRDVAEAYEIPPGWLPLLGGLRLWLLREGGGPVGVAWDEVTARLYGAGGRHLTPNDIAELCDQYAAWNLAPIDLSIPLNCNAAVDGGAYLISLPVTLAALGLPETFENSFTQDSSSGVMTSTGRRVGLALLFEYMVERYGGDSLPVLLGALARHETWDTLVPAVYGVSIEEFEERWQTWRAE
jgi:hypothetical protein